MRILSLNNCPLQPQLGSGYVSLGYAEGLRERGHTVDQYGSDELEPLRWLAPGRGVAAQQAVTMAIAAAWHVVRRSVDIVELCGASTWLAGQLATRVPRRRFAVVCRSNGLEPHYEERLRAVGALTFTDESRSSRRFARTIRRCDGLVTPSEWDGAYAQRTGLAAADRAVTIENPLPRSYLGQPLQLERPRIIGYCGSWQQVKGSELILEALPIVLRRHPEWRLKLVGVGGDVTAADFPDDVQPQIEIVPFAAREDRLLHLYRTFAIALTPSLYESFGMAAAEALACGAALVATPVGLAASLRNGEEALRLQDHTAAALVEGLETVIGNDGLRRRLAAGGHRRVQRLVWGDAVSRLEACYLEWLAKRLSPNRGSRKLASTSAVTW